MRLTLTNMPRSDREESSKKAKVTRDRVVPCTQCYPKKWACDDEAPCKNCILRSRPEKCKRMKCHNFKKGSCKKRGCTLAHEDDGYANIVSFRRMHPVDGGLSPWEELEMGTWDSTKDKGKNSGGDNVQGSDDEDGGVRV